MRKFLKVILIITSIIMLVLALSGGYIGYYVSNNREALKEMLIKQVNELTVGKWSVDSISVNVWESYPYAVVNLHNLKLYEDSLAFEAKKDILNVKNAWFRADIPSLIRKRFSVNHIGFDGVAAKLEKKDKGEFNLVQALKLNKAIEIDNHLLSFNIDKIDVSQMSIDFKIDQFTSKKPLKIERLLAKIVLNGDDVELSDCTLECYNLKFFLNLKYNNAANRVVFDFSSSSRLLKFKGDASFNEKSIITVKSNIESSIALSEYSDNRFKGELFAKGVVDLDFDFITRRLVKDRCRLKFGVNNVYHTRPLFDNAPQIVFQSGLVEYSGATIVGYDIIMGVGTNKFKLNFVTSSIIDIINRRSNYDIGISVDARADDFNPYIIKERLGILTDSVSDKNSINDLSIRLHTNITPKNMPNGGGSFGITVDDYNAKLSDDITVSDFKGEMEFADKTIYIRDFNGLINDSRTSLTSQIDILNRDSSDIFERVNISANFATSHLSTQDIGVKGQQIVMNDVKTNMNVEISPNTDIGIDYLESLKIKFNEFQATIDGKQFSQRSIIIKNRDKIEVQQAKLKYDEDSFDLSGSLYFGSKNKNIRDTLKIKSDKFDFKRLVNNKITGSTELPNVEVPIVVYLNVDKFILLDQELRGVKGEICIEKNRSLLFKDMSCFVAGGEIDFSGKLMQNSGELNIQSSVKYRNIDFEDLNVKYKISKNDNERYVNENMRGVISGTMNAELFVDKNINVDTKRSTIDAKFTIINGRLVDFAPVKAAAKYFQRSNLNDIRFDTLSNHITIKSGVISIPRMNIASTLGNYFVSGSSSIDDGKMNFMLEVPWNVIGGVVASRIFGGKSRDAESIDGDIKKRYVKFHVVGTPESYEIKLRNRSDEKLNK